jgi:hypothetical protein
MGAGSPVGSAGLRFKLQGQDELKREARKLAGEVQEIMKRAGVGNFGYASRMLSGGAVTAGQRHAGIAELNYAQHATDAASREALRQASSATERQQIRETWQQTRSTFAQARAIGGLAEPASSRGWGSGLGPFHPARLGLGFVRGLIGFGAIGAPTYYVAQALRRMMVTEQGREADIGDTMNRLAPAGGLSSLYNLTMHGGTRARMTPAEFTRFTAGMGAAAGAVATPLASQAAMMSRAFGIAPGRAANIFGGEARLGVDTLEGQKRFAGYIAEAVQHGRMRGREGEVFESIQKATEGLADFFGTTGAQNASMQGAMATTLGILANPKIPGLEGAAGMAAMIRANSAIAGASVLNMPDILTPITAIMMQRHGGTIAEKLRFQQQMLVGPDTTSQAGRQNLIDMFKLANQYMPGGTGAFQLAQQLGGPIYMEMARAFMNPGKGMTSEQALARVNAEADKLTPAQEVERKLAEWKEKEAEAGVKLVPVMLDFTELMIKLSPLMIDLATALAKFVDDWNKSGPAVAVANAAKDMGDAIGLTTTLTGPMESWMGVSATNKAQLREVMKSYRKRHMSGFPSAMSPDSGDIITADQVAGVYNFLTKELHKTPEEAYNIITGGSDDAAVGLAATTAEISDPNFSTPKAVRQVITPKKVWKTGHPSTPSEAEAVTSIVTGKGDARKAMTVIINAEHAHVHPGPGSHSTSTPSKFPAAPMLSR